MATTDPARRRRSSVVNGRRSSLLALENGALATGEERTIRSSIGGRLGGSIRTSMEAVTAADLAALYDDSDDDDNEAGEGTPLVKKPPPSLLLEETPPSLLVWIFPALACASCYAFYNIFIKKGSFTIHPILGGVILQFVAAVLGSALLAAIVVTGDAKGDIEYNKPGVLWSCAAGLAVGAAEMLSFCVSGMGVDATQSIPIIIGGSVLFGAVLGLLLLGEKMMLYGWFGVSMLITGIGLVATDPGDKVEEGGGTGDTVDEAPPLVVWIGPALFCALQYALYNIFIKLGSSSINPILGGVILQFVAALLGSVLLGVISIKEGGFDYLNYDGMGILWSCCAGVAVGAAEMLSFCVSGLGVPATQSIPIIIGGSVMVGAVLGLIMLGETLMLQGWLGVTLLMAGVAVVATDPGEKMEGH